MKVLKIQITLILVALGIISISALITYYTNQNRLIAFNSNQTLKSENHTWDYYRIVPNEAAKNYTLSLKSNLGQIQGFENLTAFGLSNSKDLLATIVGKELKIYDIKSKDSKTININLESFKLNLGNSLEWDLNDEHIATSIIDLTNNQTLVLIANVNEATNRRFAEFIPSTPEFIEPIYFSKVSNKLVVRSYKPVDLEFPDKDGKLLSQYEIPTYLTIYDYLKKEVIAKELIIDDTVDKFVYYGFDNQGLIKYYSSEMRIDGIIPDSKFTKISL